MSVPWTFGVVVTRFRRGIRLPNSPNTCAWFQPIHNPRRRGMLGVLAFSVPDLSDGLVTHEMLHAMCRYVYQLRRRKRRIPSEIRAIERRTRFQREEVIAYGVQQAPMVYRELRDLVRKISEN